MFSKKKRNKKIFLKQGKNEKRLAYRYERPEKVRMHAKIGKNEYEIINISATGMAVKNTDLESRKKYQVVLTFPEKKMLIKVNTELLFIDKSNICHFQFLELTEKVRDDLHQYIFERQMLDVREKKFLT